jgi:putative addiction module killer protein
MSYPFGYIRAVIEVQRTERFHRWLSSLRDRTAAAIVAARILRVQKGLLGDVRSVGAGVSELRVDHGPGYRVYFTRRGKTLILLLCGGDKSTQAADIKTAQAMASQL